MYDLGFIVFACGDQFFGCILFLVIGAICVVLAPFMIIGALYFIVKKFSTKNLQTTGIVVEEE